MSTIPGEVHRPSNNDIAKAIAGKVLTRVFVTLAMKSINLTTEDMRDLIESVEYDLETGPATPPPDKRPPAPLRPAG